MSERYVLLVPGDVIQSGDETFTDGRWTPVARKWIGLAEVVLRPVRRRDHWKDRAERTEAQAVSLHAALKFAERHCPCGARPESPETHPHVPGCAIAKALEALEG